jgi:hypothetical protein
LGEYSCYYTGYKDPEKETGHHNRDCGGPSFWWGEVGGKRLFIIMFMETKHIERTHYHYLRSHRDHANNKRERLENDEIRRYGQSNRERC